LNVTYDKAYPALISKIAPAPAGFRGYEISGFQPTAYGAEMMVFNCTDNLLALTEETGNYLRILGVTFTQSSTKTITVDDILARNSDAARATNVSSISKESSLYNRIRINRQKYGEKKFTLQSEYIQTTAAAEGILNWVIEKVSRERKNIGATVFPMPILQLGDLVSFEYKVFNNDAISDPTKQFVVYNVGYTKSGSETTMTVYVTEV